ncbi:UNVERIFIED_ORG: hypothetical protein ABIB13_002885 [Arthrobacter sp. UYEF2]
MDSRLARIRSRSLFGNPSRGQLNGLHFQAGLTGALETEKKATTASDEHASVLTGEVGGKTVAELGGRYAEVGHAERRRIFGEDDTVIGLKTAAACRNGLTPILCVGELHAGSPEEAVAQCSAEIDSRVIYGGSAGPGLSSDAFFWQLSDKVAEPLSIHQALERTAELGVDLFQVCDYAPLETMTDSELVAVWATADRLGIALELGTKGIRVEHLRKFLHIARDPGLAPAADHVQRPGPPTAGEAVAIFKKVLPDFEAAGV